MVSFQTTDKEHTEWIKMIYKKGSLYFWQLTNFFSSSFLWKCASLKHKYWLVAVVTMMLQFHSRQVLCVKECDILQLLQYSIVQTHL